MKQKALTKKERKTLHKYIDDLPSEIIATYGVVLAFVLIALINDKKIK